MSTIEDYFIDADQKVLCPKYERKIAVGLGGIENFKQRHLDSDTCKANAKAKKKASESQKSLRSITSFFSAKSKATPVPPTVLPPGPVHATLPTESKDPLHVARLSDTEPLSASVSTSSIASNLPVHPACGLASLPVHNDVGVPTLAQRLVDDLKLAARCLTDSVLEGREGDAMARFAKSRWPVPDSDDEVWDCLDPVLNQVIGYGIMAEVLAQNVRRGERGLDGLVALLEHFMRTYGVSGALLEGKMKVLFRAVEILVPGFVRTLTSTTTARSADDCAPVAEPVNTNTAILASMPTHSPLLPHHVQPPPASETAAMSSAFSNDQPAPATSTNPSAPANTSNTTITSNPHDTSTSLDTDITYIGTSTPRTTRCKGYHLVFPPGKTANSSYPFMLHDRYSLPWDFESHSGLFALRARSCAQRARITSQCVACTALSANDIVRGIQHRIIHGVKEHSPYAYHGLGGMVEVARRKEVIIDEFRLHRLNDSRHIITVEGAFDTAKQILQAAATRGDGCRRFSVALSNAFARNLGLHAILEMMMDTVEGTHHPKSYDERDDAQGMLMLQLGGSRVANISHRALEAPATTTLRQRDTMPRLLLSPGFPIEHEIECNIEACFAGITDLVSSANVLHAVLMYDELAVEKRPRYDDETDRIVGGSREDGGSASIRFRGVDDMETFFDDVVCGEVRLASEATVGAIGILSREPHLYSARPILISGSCKKENAHDHARLLHVTLKATNNKKELTNVRVVCKASDGERRRGAALIEEACHTELPATSPIQPNVGGMEFMDYLTGEDNITIDKDYKHVFKRLRNVLLRLKGIFVNGVWIKPAAIRQHLLDAGHSAAHVHAMFNPKDRQDVLTAYHLLRDLWTLPSTDDIRPAYVETREALRTYGTLCYHLIFPYICVDLSLSEQLEHLSAAAHLNFTLYDVNHEAGNSADDFVPTTLYLDIMHMVKNALFCVAKAQVDNPDSEFFLILLGTDRLETLFSILRTMVGNDANLDLLQLSLRLTGTTKVANIMAKYPEWDKGPHRLRLPFISRDSNAVPDGADHINPRLWRGNLFVALVTLTTCWKRGRRMVEDRFSFITTSLTRLRTYPKSTILAPYGTPLFKIPFAAGDNEDDDEEDEFRRSHEDGCTTSDALDGLRQLEDAAGDLNWDASGAPKKFVRAVTIDGKPVNKARALAQRFKYQKSSTSTDRLRRVAQEGRYRTVAGLTDEEEYVGLSLSIFDPVAKLVRCEDKYFLGIGEVNIISVDSKSRQRVALNLLPESTVHVSYQILHLVPTTTDDDPTAKHDWRSSRPLPYTFTVPGILIQPINPLTAPPISGSPRLLFDSGSLRALASSLRDRLPRMQLREVPTAKVTADFPYRERGGQACFLAEGSSDVHDSMPHTCPACSPPIKLDLKHPQTIIAHIAAHLLKDTTLDRRLELCGMCLRPAAICKFHIQKTKGDAENYTITPRGITCPNFAKFSWAVAANTASSSPCSNAPLRCPICPEDSPAVWRYNMLIHFENSHPVNVTNPQYRSIWQLTDFEEEKMGDLWDGRHKKKATRKKKNTVDVPRLVISEAHSGRATLNNVRELNIDEVGDQGDEDGLGTTESVNDDGEEEEEEEGEERVNDGTGGKESINDKMDEEIIRMQDQNSLEDENALDERGRGVMDDYHHRVQDILQDGEVILSAMDGEQVGEGGLGGVGTDMDVDVAPVCEDIGGEPKGTADNYGSATADNTTSPTTEQPTSFLSTTTAANFAANKTPGSRPSRAGRKRMAEVLTTLSECVCGDRVTEEEVAKGVDVVRCKASGCETQWYHLACADLEMVPHSFTCQSCSKGKRSHQ